MDSLFRMRVRVHQKKMQRYLQYVFNDHFALLMTFLLGAAGLYYSNLLKSLTIPFKPGLLILLVIWVVSLSFGRYATLTQPADQVFLLPKETQMKKYLNQSLKYSFTLPFGVAFLIIGAGMPLYVVSSGGTFKEFFYLWGTFLFLKAMHLFKQQLAVFQHTPQFLKVVTILFWVVAFGTFIVSLYVSTIGGFALAAILLVATSYLTMKKIQAPIDWEQLIALEQKRMYRVYRFINLFTDVPQIAASVKRRKYLDVLLNRVKPTQPNTFYYLYIRRFFRGTEFSGLVLRLWLVGGIALWFVSDLWLVTLLAIVFSYLIGFQLFPLYSQFDYIPQIQLYPITKVAKIASFKKLLALILLLTTILYGGIGSIHLQRPIDSLVLLLALLVFDFVFYVVYVPKRMRKLNG